MARSSVEVALLLAALGAASGCSTGRQAVRLTWPPPGETLAPSPPSTAPAVSLRPLEDRRSGPRTAVGEMRNLIYFTEDLETTDDVARWVTEALRDELQRAGVRVVGASAGAPVLGGELTLAQASGWISYSADATIHAWLRSGEAVIYDAQVQGEGSAGYILLATTEGYEVALADAVRAAARSVAFAVATRLAEAPRGEPTTGPEPVAAAPPPVAFLASASATSPPEPQAAPPPDASPPAAPSQQATPAPGRADWYVGVLISLASVDTSGPGASLGFSLGEGQVLPLAATLQLGVPVRRRLLAGLEGNLAYAWHSIPAGQPQAGNQDRDVVLTQVLATITFYPLERPELSPGDREVAPRGWYLRGGAGLASLRSSPDPQYAPTGSTPWSVGGPALSAASGWAYWATRARTLTGQAELDLSWQFYGAGPPEPERSFSMRFSFGCVFF